MKTNSCIILTLITFFLLLASFYKPEFLGANAFLQKFINDDFIELLIVVIIFALTLATYILLEFARIERIFQNKIFDAPRAQVKFGAKILLGSFFASFLLLFFKAGFISYIWISISSSIAIVLLTAVILVLYDFMETIIVISSNEPHN